MRRTLSEPEPVTGPSVYTEAVYAFMHTVIDLGGMERNLGKLRSV